MRIHRVAPRPALFLLLAASVVLADPATQHFEPLVVEMNQRELALDFDTKEGRKQEKSLLKGFKVLSKDSSSIPGDLKMAGKLEKALAKGWKGDEELDGLFSDLADNLSDDVALSGGGLEVILEGLAPGKVHDKVQKSLQKGDAFLASADAEDARNRRLKLLAKAEKQYQKGVKTAVKASPAPPSGTSFFTAVVQGQAWQSNDDFGPGVSGQVGVSVASGGIRRLQLRGRHIFPSVEPPPPNAPPGANLPGVENILDISLTGISADIVPGTYFVGNNSGISLSATWTVIDEEDEVRSFVATSGSITLTDVVALLGSGSAEGSFGFTLEDLVDEGIVTVGSGTFEAFSLQRTNVE